MKRQRGPPPIRGPGPGGYEAPYQGYERKQPRREAAHDPYAARPYYEDYRGEPPPEPYYEARRDFQGPPAYSAPPVEAPPVPAPDLPADPVFYVEVPIKKQYAGIIIGPGGESASRIRKQARVQLHVRRDVLPGDLQIVELTGTAEQCTAGVELMRSLIHETDPSAQVEESRDSSYQIDVLPEMVGPVLGAKGSTARNIREKTGSSLRISEINPETGLQTITLGGRITQMRDAYRMVRAILSKFDPGRVKGPPPREYMPPGEEQPPPPGHFPPHRPPPGSVPPPMYDTHHPPHTHMGPPPVDPRDPRMRGVPEEGPRAGPGGYGDPRARDYPPARSYAPPGPADGPPAAQQPLHAMGGARPGPASASGAEPPPQILLLQPDGTYKPAQLLMMNGAQQQQQQQQQQIVAPSAAAAPQQSLHSVAQPSMVLPSLSAALAQLAAQQQPQGASAASGAAGAATGAGSTPAVLSQAALTQMAAAIAAATGGSSMPMGLSQQPHLAASQAAGAQYATASATPAATYQQYYQTAAAQQPVQPVQQAQQAQQATSYQYSYPTQGAVAAPAATTQQYQQYQQSGYPQQQQQQQAMAPSTQIVQQTYPQPTYDY